MKYFTLLSLSILLFPAFSLAQVIPVALPSEAPVASIEQAFRQFKEINAVDINAPTVVEIPIEEKFTAQRQFGVLDLTDNTFQPFYLKTTETPIRVALLTVPEDTTGTANNMIDDNLNTHHDFPLPDNSPGQATITIASPDTITTSSIAVILDNNVTLPETVEVITMDQAFSQTIVVAQRKMTTPTITFPRNTGTIWQIKLTFSQPLRIDEIKLNQENTGQINTLRFLAQPQHPYRIYLNPDRAVNLPRSESGNLSQDINVLSLPAVSTQPNPLYSIADSDQDGIPDEDDNCKNIANPDQADINNNNIGDACDDFDRDGIINSKDNCPNIPNRNQRDEDGDGIGDVCDQEESRVTERHPWIPWVGIGFAALVVIVLLILTINHTPPNSPPPTEPPTTNTQAKDPQQT